MRHFSDLEIAEAVAHADGGGQALHVHSIIVDRSRAPRCFLRAVDRGEKIAHLIDQDEARLVATARRLGVRVIVVERRGTARQHIDLCGAPLRKALAMCEKEPDHA